MIRYLVLFFALTLGLVNGLRADVTAEKILPLDTNALATLAVQDHGRKKPFTTFAQEMVLTLSGHSPLTLENPDGSKVTLPPEQVLLDLWFAPEGWDDRRVIMLNFLELKKKLGMPEDRKLFSFNELIKQQALLDILDEAQKLRQAGKGDDLTALQKEAEHLGERLRLFQDLVEGSKQTVVPNPFQNDGHWMAPVSMSEGGIQYATGVWLKDEPPLTDAQTATINAAGPKITSWFRAYHDEDIKAFNAQTSGVVEALHAIAPQFIPRLPHSNSSTNICRSIRSCGRGSSTS